MIDLHMHSVASDGTDTLEQLLQNVRKAGIDTFSVTDHDTIEGALAMQKLVRNTPLRFTLGIEFSCKHEAEKYHILGYDFDPSNALFRETIEEGIRFRRNNAVIRLNWLKETKGIDFGKETEAALLANPTVGKPHIAMELVKRGIAKDVDDGCEYLQVETPRLKLEVSQAVQAIHAAGGIAVWAHPLGGDGEPKKSESYFRELLAKVLPLGIDGLECYYGIYTEPQIDCLVRATEEYGLLRSGGSDYHGSVKNVALGNTGDKPWEEKDFSIVSRLFPN